MNASKLTWRQKHFPQFMDDGSRFVRVSAESVDRITRLAREGQDASDVVAEALRSTSTLKADVELAEAIKRLADSGRPVGRKADD